MPIETILTTRRVRLRTWRLSDASDYHRYCNTPAVMEFLGGCATLAHVRAEVRWYQQDQERHGHTFWIIERQRDKAFIGFAGVIRVPERETPLHGKLEIGWRVRADMWRRGYGYEAAHGVVEWARSELSGEPLYARIHRDNAASQGMARKLGMRRTRKLERQQGWDDIDLYVFKMGI